MKLTCGHILVSVISGNKSVAWIAVRGVLLFRMGPGIVIGRGGLTREGIASCPDDSRGYWVNDVSFEEPRDKRVGSAGRETGIPYEARPCGPIPIVSLTCGGLARALAEHRYAPEETA